MSCYFCWNKNTLKIDDNGNCHACGRAACAPPPARPDGRFHGDGCAFSGCGLFFCLPHMHTHPDDKDGVSGTFPKASVVLATNAIKGATVVGNQVDGFDATQQSEAVQSLELFLNCITPGSTALVQMSESLPEDVTRIKVIDDNKWMIFDREFFRRTVTTMVGLLASRSLWIAASALGLTEHPRTRAAFDQWPSQDRLHVSRFKGLDVDVHWFAEVLSTLPPMIEVSHWSFEMLPPESESRTLVRELAARYNEGEAGISASVSG